MAPSKGNKNNFNRKKKEKKKRTLSIFKKNWPAEVETTNIKLGNTKNDQYYVTFYILKGTKLPELYFMWLHNY